MASLEQWIKDFPVVTRTYVASALLTTAACALDLISPFSLYFSFTMVWQKGQFWRIFTNFFFFGAKFSLEFLFHMFFLVQYCRSLEEGSFRGRTADFVWMILFGGSLLLLVAPLAQIHFLGGSLTFMMVYIWARRNPFVPMGFLGLFRFTAPYLPWVLLSFSCLLGNDVMVDCLGIAIGHLYYYLEDIYPLMTPTRKRLLKTPRIIELLFSGGGGGGVGGGDHDPHPIVNFEHEAVIQEQIAQQAAIADGQQPPAQQQQRQEEEDEGVILAE